MCLDDPRSSQGLTSTCALLTTIVAPNDDEDAVPTSWRVFLALTIERMLCAHPAALLHRACLARMCITTKHERRHMPVTACTRPPFSRLGHASARSRSMCVVPCCHGKARTAMP